jgi:uncharacterized membrane protein
MTHTHKKLDAKIYLGYMNPVTKEIVNKDSDVPITVEFDEVVKSWNTGLLFIIFIILLLIYIISRRRKKPKKVTVDSTDEIAALERAQSIMFAKMAAKLEKSEIKKTIRKSSTKE